MNTMNWREKAKIKANKDCDVCLGTGIETIWVRDEEAEWKDVDESCPKCVTLKRIKP